MVVVSIRMQIRRQLNDFARCCSNHDIKDNYVKKHQLKLKNIYIYSFLKKKIENTKICYY